MSDWADELKEYDDLIAAAAKQYGLDANLVRSIVSVESSYNTWAVRHEPRSSKYLVSPRDYASQLMISDVTETICQMSSWGLMQVMGFVARENGYSDFLTKLCVPEVGLNLGCQHLKKFFQRYGLESAAISSYNQGSPRKTAGGMYENQTYVDKVYSNLVVLRRIQ